MLRPDMPVVDEDGVALVCAVLNGTDGDPLNGCDIVMQDVNMSGRISAHMLAETAPKSWPMTQCTFW